MKIFVTVKTGSRQDEVEKIGLSDFKVKVREQAEKGKANKAVCRLLAEHFGVAQSQVEVVSGFTSAKKIIQIYES
ncbi:MAG: hypothetical protein A2653_02090 [Candidatus Zambryskibacteria bacterium RIFCSPHIGHO2_01_FULL_43_25]|uniref:Uncharacterized protein n=1 Tax=Candidatus Zambryskibacteria bacterium RIFCSPLOWO2_01_FULL_45_21 TaxID=1802761 RepID=A0A1G2U2R3_9BACT|nr:MAG: hypothetical protein A2653_02090 [Candidatus Zambryskibacteria bacterium RIFCSPHIGHO2_01_FULL_43_25]OHA99981.1 MAG: hypothetical protein A3E94_03135 [Candidatus Zambryskibacteria bacterium RIFCSPHIGHO2_12_FULL_44_12b]OHB03817.1 MAG: hypothetical protein A3B14_03950 [Candidatus Zambryskibacteria bacterium RIFCSPLOWO2_01_FULL_45_21]